MKSSATRTPIATAVGTLHGRDCIYLDAVAYDPAGRTLGLKGTLNGNLCSRLELTRGHMFPFVFVFESISALQITPIDDWLQSDRNQQPDSLLPDNPELPRVCAVLHEIAPKTGDSSSPRRTICAITYDDVIELVCNTINIVLPTLLRDKDSLRLDPDWYETWDTVDATAGALASIGDSVCVVDQLHLYSDTAFLRWVAALQLPAE